MVNNIIYNENLTRSNASNIENNTKETYIYKMNEQLPKKKGSNVNVGFINSKQLEHLLNVVSKSYTDYEVHEEENYIELINRKRGK
jgi:hypothetical protein